MRNKLKITISLAVIIALTWIDYQYFTEGAYALSVGDTKRKIYHLLFLGLITLAGYFGWSSHPAAWLKKIWLLAYAVGISVLLMLELANHQFHIFGTEFMKNLGNMRAFFCSPMPFFILLILSRLQAMYRPAAN